MAKFFECQNKLCMDMYNPAKFYDFSIIFQDFMRGGMFCPPPNYVTSKKPVLNRVKKFRVCSWRRKQVEVLLVSGIMEERTRKLVEKDFRPNTYFFIGM